MATDARAESRQRPVVKARIGLATLRCLQRFEKSHYALARHGERQAVSVHLERIVGIGAVRVDSRAAVDLQKCCLAKQIEDERTNFGSLHVQKVTRVVERE